jgi:membrane-associated protein
MTAVPLALGPQWIHPDTLLTDFGGVALWGAAAVIFAECGLLIGFFMPGDSLLFTVGLFVGRGDIHYPLWLACLVMTAAAFLGNVVGYEIGRASGPAIFSRGNSRIFKQEYVDKTMDFFEQYGPRAIVMARFVPIIRTFITVTAGVGKMDRRKFLTYSGIGAVLWACGVTILGRVLGSVAIIREHIEAALLLVVLISVIPMVVEYLRHRSAARRTAATRPAVPQSGLPGPGTGVPGPGTGVPGPGTGVPGPGTGVPGSGVPGSGFPGSGMPGSGMPGSGMPGSGMPGSEFQGSVPPGSALPGSVPPGSGSRTMPPGAGRHVGPGTRGSGGASGRRSDPMSDREVR